MPRKKAATYHSKLILKRRFINKLNEYTEWQDIGHGEFISMEDVQDKIKLLIQNYKNKHMEVHFEINGKLLDFNGNEISHPIKFTPK
jgi:hypothetical protein